MVPDVLGDMLEERGLSDDEIDAVLAHAGVKGMKWDHRKAARRTAAGVTGAVAMRLVGNKTGNVKLALAVGAGAAYAVNNVLKKHGDKPVSELSK